MNLIEKTVFKQPKVSPSDESLCRNLRQAIKVISGEYQKIDWEELIFLTNTLSDAIDVLEAKGGN